MSMFNLKKLKKHAAILARFSTYRLVSLTEKHKRISLDIVFGLSIVSYCRNMGVSVEEDPLPGQIYSNGLIVR